MKYIFEVTVLILTDSAAENNINQKSLMTPRINHLLLMKCVMNQSLKKIGPGLHYEIPTQTPSQMQNQISSMEVEQRRRVQTKATIGG